MGLSENLGKNLKPLVYHCSFPMKMPILDHPSGYVGKILLWDRVINMAYMEISSGPRIIYIYMYVRHICKYWNGLEKEPLLVSWEMTHTHTTE